MDLDYVEALEYGLPLKGGMSIDILIIWLTGQEFTQEVILFSRMNLIKK